MEFDDRARPAMGDDQRQRLRMGRTNVEEMNVEPVDFSRELRKAIEQRLAAAPIIRFSPIAADLLDPFQRRALAPVVDQFGFRPSGPAQSRSEIVEHIVADRDAKRLDVSTHGKFPSLTRDLSRPPKIIRNPRASVSLSNLA